MRGNKMAEAAAKVAKQTGCSFSEALENIEAVCRGLDSLQLQATRAPEISAELRRAGREATREVPRVEPCGVRAITLDPDGV